MQWSMRRESIFCCFSSQSVLIFALCDRVSRFMLCPVKLPVLQAKFKLSIDHENGLYMEQYKICIYRLAFACHLLSFLWPVEYTILLTTRVKTREIYDRHPLVWICIGDYLIIVTENILVLYFHPYQNKYN